jgi:hypothetical protein
MVRIEEKIYQEIQVKGLQWKLNEYDWSDQGPFRVKGNPVNHSSAYFWTIKATLNFTKGRNYSDLGSAEMRDYVQVKMFLDFSSMNIEDNDFARAVERFKSDNVEILQIWEAARVNQVEANPTNLETIDQLQKQNTQLTQELTTERETTQQALQVNQEWHERQKNEIIAQWKTKLTNFLTSRKQKLIQEIQLIREVLNE